MLMGGLSAAFAGVMAKMGLKSAATDGSVTSGSSGIVSKRMAMAQSGAVVMPLDDGGSVAPSFIEIPHESQSTRSMPVAPGMLDVDEGVEVEGPYRPSASYAADSNMYEL